MMKSENMEQMTQTGEKHSNRGKGTSMSSEFSWVDERDRARGQFLSDTRRRLLQENMDTLTRQIDLETTILMDDLLQRAVVTQEQKEIIQEQEMEENQIKILIKMILKKTNQAYEDFCAGLVKSGQRHIVRNLLIDNDDLRAAQQHLARYFLYDFCHLNLLTRHGGRHAVPLEKLYQPMVWKQVKQDMTGYEQIEHKSHGEIFSKMEMCKRILVEGQPGTGKTTFTKRLAWEWAKQFLTNTSRKEENSVITMFSLVIPIILRHLQQGFDLYDAMKNQYGSILSESELCSIEHFLNENPEQVLLIMDGYDEFKGESVPALERIIINTEYVQVTCLTTTRPIGMQTLKYKTSAIDMYVVLCGYSRKDIENYIRMFFEGDQGKADAMVSFISSANPLMKLAEIPVLLEPMCILWELNGKLGSTRWEIYEEFVQYLFDHMETKLSSQLGPNEIQHIKYEMAKLANTWNEDGTLALVFSDGCLQKLFGNFQRTILAVGCLYKSHPMTIREKSSWGFLHKTFQEYFIGTLLVSASKDEHLEEFIKHCSSETGFKEAFPILEFLYEKERELCFNIISEAFAQFEGSSSEMARLINFTFKSVKTWDSTMATYLIVPLESNILWIDFSSAQRWPFSGSKKEEFEISVVDGDFSVKLSCPSQIVVLPAEIDEKNIKPTFSTSLSPVALINPVLQKISDKIMSSSLKCAATLKILLITFPGILAKLDVFKACSNFVPKLASIGTLKELRYRHDCGGYSTMTCEGKTFYLPNPYEKEIDVAHFLDYAETVKGNQKSCIQHVYLHSLPWSCKGVYLGQFLVILKSLKTLDLQYVITNDDLESVLAVFESTDYTWNLTSLVLGLVYMREEKYQRRGKILGKIIARMPNLTSLDIRNHELLQQDMAEMAAEIHSPTQIQYFKVGGNWRTSPTRDMTKTVQPAIGKTSLTLDSWKALCRNMPQLKAAHLSTCGITKKKIARVMEAFINPTLLAELDLHGNDLSKGGLCTLVKSLSQFTAISKIDICNCQCAPNEVKDLFATMPSSLKFLNIMWNKLGDQLLFLTEATMKSKLEQLDHLYLDENETSVAVARQVSFAVLQANPRVKAHLTRWGAFSVDGFESYQ